MRFFPFFLAGLALAGTCPALYAQARVSAAEQRFVRQAAQDGIAELEMARLAETRGVAEAVKEYAAKAIAQREKLDAELRELAQAKGIEIHAAADKEGRAGVRALAARKGLDFDRRYLLSVMKDLDRDLRVFRKALREAKDPDVKDFAAKHAALIEEQGAEVRKVVDAGSATLKK